MSNPEVRRARARQIKKLFAKATERRLAGGGPGLAELAEAMRSLKQDKLYLLLRDDGWTRLFEMFVQFCETEAVSEQARNEILLMQARAACEISWCK